VFHLHAELGEFGPQGLYLVTGGVDVVGDRVEKE